MKTKILEKGTEGGQPFVTLRLDFDHHADGIASPDEAARMIEKALEGILEKRDEENGGLASISAVQREMNRKIGISDRAFLASMARDQRR